MYDADEVAPSTPTGDASSGNLPDDAESGVTGDGSTDGSIDRSTDGSIDGSVVDPTVGAGDIDAGEIDPGEIVDVGLVESDEFGIGIPESVDVASQDASGAHPGGDVAAERDEYRDALLRVKAEFDNYRKRSAKEHGELVARANVGLATELLPVLDACDAALGHGATDVEPIMKSLLDILGKEGLERMDPVGDPFDPNLHEAVAHEDGDGSDPVVTETFRIGYSWKGQVLRAPMVKVRG